MKRFYLRDLFWLTLTVAAALGAYLAGAKQSRTVAYIGFDGWRVLLPPNSDALLTSSLRARTNYLGALELREERAVPPPPPPPSLSDQGLFVRNFLMPRRPLIWDTQDDERLPLEAPSPGADTDPLRGLFEFKDDAQKAIFNRDK